MRDKPPSQLVKAGGGRGNAVMLGPRGAGLAVSRNWGGLSFYIGGFAPIYPPPSSGLGELGGQEGRDSLEQAPTMCTDGLRAGVRAAELGFCCG